MNQKKPATLKSYGRAFQTISMSAAADARIRRALDAHTPPARRWLPALWALPLAACGLLVFWLTRPEPTTARGCDVVRESADTRYTGSCDVALTAMTVHLAADATFVQQESNVLLAAGTAHFSVRKVRPGERPVEIRIPEASIVVLGTEFTVTVTDNTSRVHLRSGRVRFVHQGHGAVEMLPGQQLTFETKTGKTEVVTVSTTPADDPEHDATSVDSTADDNTADDNTAGNNTTANNTTPPATPPLGVPEVFPSNRPGRALTPPSAHAEPTSSATAAPPTDLQVALELRAQGRYDEALARLGNVNPPDARAREVVDFEQATLIELQAPQRACSRYRQHLSHFPDSRYRAAVLQKLARCAAPDVNVDSREGESSP
jgi:hypothetical protein